LKYHNGWPDDPASHYYVGHFEPFFHPKFYMLKYRIALRSIAQGSTIRQVLTQQNKKRAMHQTVDYQLFVHCPSSYFNVQKKITP
jgi:hypothetical protein